MTEIRTGGPSNRPAGSEGTPMLAIRLLGSVEVRRDGALVEGFRSAKAQALLYYLAARGQAVQRATLLGLFWADGAEEQGRANLNQTLSNLRKLLGDALLVTRQAVALDPQHVQVDATDLAAAAARARQMDTGALLAAAALHRGDLLEGFLVRDAAEFELWLQGERERLRQAAITLLSEAARRSEEAGDTARGAEALRRLLHLEPWRESAHRQLMLLLARSGERDAALAQYAACRAALAAALDVEPDAATEQLHAAIRAGQIVPTPPIFASLTPSPAHPTDLQSDTPSPRHPLTFSPPPHNLPPQSTPFIGRAHELAEVLHCLAAADCRLLTLVGPGGIGKSRLALQAAQAALDDRALAQQFAGGVFYVALAGTDTLADTLAGALAAVAAAVGLQFYDHTPAQQQLVDFLANKRLLLVLDNLEQLLEGETEGPLLQWLGDLVAAAPLVKLLVTTRTALSLQEAWFFPLGGLSLPPASAAAGTRAGWTGEHSGARSGWAEDDFAAVEQSDAVQLFLQSARRARVGFSLSTTQAAVARICHLVDGAPLAIELAAAWLTVLTAEQVAAEVARSLDILTARHQNTPARHRSMRAVCESTWRLLPPPLAAVMRRLAVQRGGFRLEAAAALAGASIFDLAALAEKSLLRQADDGRYATHELLRQVALEQLAASGELDEARRRHARYYLQFLAQRGPQLVGPGQRQALEELAAEQENLHAAWQAAVEGGDWELLESAHTALYEFLQVRSSYWEGKAQFDQAAAAARGRADWTGDADTSSPAHPLTPSLLLRLQARQGAFAFHLGQYGEAAALAERSLAQASTLGLAADTAWALNLLGQIAGWQGEREAARRHLQASLHLCRESGDRAGQASALHKLAQVEGSVGDYAEARRYAEESLALCRPLGRPDWIGYALDVLGWVTLCLGDYGACTEHYTASLQLFRASGDRLGAALALGGLGSVEWARGGNRLLPAAAYMTESLNLCRAIGHRHHAASRLWYLGQIAVEQGDYWLGRAHGEEGRALAEAVGSRVFVAYNLCVLGAAEAGLGNRRAAQQHLLAVLRIAGEVEHLPPLLIALIELARLCQGAAAPAERLALARASLAAVIAHPACWQPYRVRAQGVDGALAAAGAPAPPVQSLAQVVAAWQAVAD